MKAKIKNILLVLSMLTMTLQPGFVAAGLPEAVNYLRAQNDNPWITMALVAAGETDIPTSHLRNVSGDLATDYAKTILALTALGQDPTTFGNIDYVSQLKSYYDGTQMGDANLLNDDAWSILALASVYEEGSPEAIAAKDFLLANQNANGGWSYSVGAGSDTNDTAAVVIALLEMGVSASDSVITDAFSYIQSAQNSDGGFGYQVGSDSDSGSDSWVIWALYKAGIDPTSWSVGNNNPITHLESLQDTDGGFWWVAEGASEWNNKNMTPYAVIALSGQTHPIGYFQPGSGSQPGTYSLRIEGENSNICNTYVAGATAYDLLENGAVECGYTFSGNRDYGTFFLESIDGIVPSPPSSWMYLVNNEMAMAGLEDLGLEEGDEILIYYDPDYNSPAYPDYDRPLKVEASENNPEENEDITITVSYFDSGWHALGDATVFGGDQEYQTDSGGEVQMSLPAGYYTIYAEKQDFIRSNQEIIMVGEGVSQNVGLTVEIDQGGHGNIGGESIIFDVDTSQLDFGSLEPGETGSQMVTLSNSGTVDLNIAAAVSGDSVFTENIKIESQIWSSYSSSLDINSSQDAEVSLEIPSDYIVLGVKTGELIFWAQTQ